MTLHCNCCRRRCQHTARSVQLDGLGNVFTLYVCDACGNGKLV